MKSSTESALSKQTELRVPESSIPGRVVLPEQSVPHLLFLSCSLAATRPCSPSPSFLSLWPAACGTTASHPFPAVCSSGSEAADEARSEGTLSWGRLLPIFSGALLLLPVSPQLLLPLPSLTSTLHILGLMLWAHELQQHL